tara:strand:+ start:315 stop:560 length:246 start_codon:yes stop_codon:yes gene_type:complete
MSYQKSQIQILKLNNKTYLPFQLHQLPKYFNTSTTDYFNHKGYCYISLNDILDNNPYFNLQTFKDNLTFDKNMPMQYTSAK